MYVGKAVLAAGSFVVCVGTDGIMVSVVVDDVCEVLSVGIIVVLVAGAGVVPEGSLTASVRRTGFGQVDRGDKCNSILFSHPKFLLQYFYHRFH